MQQMARDLAALRQNVDQLIASQNQMARQMARLQSDLCGRTFEDARAATSRAPIALHLPARKPK
jgi:cell division protein FtsB